MASSHSPQSSSASLRLPSDQASRLTSPSRIPRPSLSVIHPSPLSVSSASYAQTSSPGQVKSRKRPRQSNVSRQSFDSDSMASPPFISSHIASSSPSVSFVNVTPSWKHSDHLLSLQPTLESPPPMVNSNYNLAGGMDTPSILAEKQYEHMDTDTLDGRFGREKLAAYRQIQISGQNDTDQRYILGTDRNGHGRGNSISTPKESWSSFVMGMVGNVAGGVWSFCKSTVFPGFSAGGGQAYQIPTQSGDYFGHESSWENEFASRSWDRLPTPVPGEYPGDTPSEEEDENGRGAKRLHSDGGGWIVVENPIKSGASPVKLQPLSTPTIHREKPYRGRMSSGTSRKTKLSIGSRSHRVSSVSYSGSPLPLLQPKSHDNKLSKQLHRRSRSKSPAPNSSPSRKRSPPSEEARKFAARIKRESKVSDEKFERLNDRLKNMIQQGKEALGSKVEVVENDDQDMW